MTRTLADLSWPLHTERLTLRPARSEDAAEIWPWYALPEVHEWTSGRPAFLASHQEQWDEQLTAGVVGLEDGRLIASGVVRLHDLWAQSAVADRARGAQAELGWVLDPARHGQGLGTEFAEALLGIAIDGLGVHRAVAECFAANVASARVMEKIGMRCEARSRKDSLHAARGWMDGMTWAILAEDRHASDAPAV